jgi:hypothetical protein
MNASDALTKIRVMLGMEPEVEATSVELAEATLADGTVVKVEGELAEGKALLVVTEEGEIPAPEGIHETSDGKLITVDAGGVITAIEDKPEEVVEEMAAEEPAAKSYDEDFLGQIAGLISPINDRIAAIEARFSALDNDFHQFRDEPAAGRIKNNLNVSTESVKSHSDRQANRMATLIELRNQK